MTATHVGGVPVIADEPALSPITTGAGEPVYFQQTRRLLLEDESIVYGCVHCDFTRPTAGQVRPHLAVHRSRSKQTTQQTNLRDLTLAELLRRLDELERVSAERDSWRTRALKAERQLGTMRKALRGDG